MKLFESIRLCGLALLLSSVAVMTSCSEDKEERQQYEGAEAYALIYNAEIVEYLEKELAQTRVDLAEAKEKLSESPEDDKLKSEVAEAERKMVMLNFRVSHGDFFKFKKGAELPKDLVWTSGEPQPPVGDERAKKGGVFNTYMTTFPSTLRALGPESNSGFRSRIYDDLEVAAVTAHPVTEKPIPGVAKEWAVSKDRKTVYYRIDPDATFSNGEKVKAMDFITFWYVRVSPFVDEPFYKQYLRESFTGFTTYGNDVIAVTLPDEKPRLVWSAAPRCAPTEFYKDYAPDYEKHYNWKVQPTTGAYYVDDKDINKGISISLRRKKDWWGYKLPQYKNLYNPDQIRYTVIADSNKAFEVFKAGKIDYFNITSPRYWSEKSEVRPVFDGYIERYKFYNQFVREPWGLYLNVTKGLLKDKNVRLGIQHCMHWEKVIEVIFRGEYSRLQSFYQGYGRFTHPDLKAREYSVVKAKEYFAKAGFTKLGPDGILVNDKGKRLSVTISFSTPRYKKIMALLKEFSKKAGFDLVLDGLERTVIYQKVQKKQHEMTFTAWASRPPFPKYFQFWHSSNALDEKGNPKPNTNNLCCYSNPLMDKYAVAVRNARSEDEIYKYSMEAQKVLWEDAVFVPAFMTNYFCTGSWRWLRWPASEYTPFCTPISSDPMENYMFWIDSKVKEETLAAKRAGKTFPEVQRVIDTFRDEIPEKFLKVKP